MRTLMRVCALLAVFGVLLTGCAAENNLLRNIPPGTTVWIDAWDENEETGDEAQVEQKPSGLWVLPLDARYALQSDTMHTVKVTLTKDGRFVIEEVLGTAVGVDRDNCLADGETYADMKVTNLAQLPREVPSPERNSEPDTDCLPTAA